MINTLSREPKFPNHVNHALQIVNYQKKMNSLDIFNTLNTLKRELKFPNWWIDGTV